MCNALLPELHEPDGDREGQEGQGWKSPADSLPVVREPPEHGACHGGRRIDVMGAGDPRHRLESEQGHDASHHRSPCPCRPVRSQAVHGHRRGDGEPDRADGPALEECRPRRLEQDHQEMKRHRSGRVDRRIAADAAEHHQARREINDAHQDRADRDEPQPARGAHGPRVEQPEHGHGDQAGHAQLLRAESKRGEECGQQKCPTRWRRPGRDRPDSLRHSQETERGRQEIVPADYHRHRVLHPGMDGEQDARHRCPGLSGPDGSRKTHYEHAADDVDQDVVQPVSGRIPPPQGVVQHEGEAGHGPEEADPFGSLEPAPALHHVFCDHHPPAEGSEEALEILRIEEDADERAEGGSRQERRGQNPQRRLDTYPGTGHRPPPRYRQCTITRASPVWQTPSLRTSRCGIFRWSPPAGYCCR